MFTTLLALATLFTASAGDIVVPHVPADTVLEGDRDPNSCDGGVEAFRTNLFTRWFSPSCADQFDRYVQVVNATELCVEMSFAGYTARSLVPALEPWEDGKEHRVSTAINTTDGVKACAEACSVTYTFQPADVATLVATGYRLPIKAPYKKTVVNGARMHLYSTRVPNENGVLVSRMEEPVAHFTDTNDIDSPTGNRIILRRSGDCEGFNYLRLPI